MNRAEAAQFVIRELGNHRSLDEVVRAVTEHVGCSWDEAQHFVQHVQFEHRTKIAARQSPLLLFLGIITIVAGSLLVLANVSLIVHRLSMQTMPSYNNLALLGTGLAMVAGATIGLWQSIRAMWK